MQVLVLGAAARMLAPSHPNFLLQLRFAQFCFTVFYSFTVDFQIFTWLKYGVEMLTGLVFR
jgi:hypothetical protein